MFNWDSCPKFVINLDRREDRAKEVFKEFDKHSIGVRRWKAVDGELLTVPELSIKKEEHNASGILACALSHTGLIEHAKRCDFSHVAIFEDDIYFADDFNEKIKRVEFGCWDICYLGGHLAKDKDNRIAGTYGYILNSSIFGFVLRNWYYRWGWDEFLGDVVQQRFKVYTCKPFIVGHKDGFSDVAGHKVEYKIDKV